jgi:predicted component of type VI protein secretion system
MKPERMLLAAALLPLVLAAACQSTAERLDEFQQAAVDTALQRARTDLSCPEATGTVLSRREIEPDWKHSSAPVSIQVGYTRAEYTIAVDGCGKRATLMVVCDEGGSGCVASPAG